MVFALDQMKLMVTWESMRKCEMQKCLKNMTSPKIYLQSHFSYF